MGLDRFCFISFFVGSKNVVWIKNQETYRCWLWPDKNYFFIVKKWLTSFLFYPKQNKMSQVYFNSCFLDGEHNRRMLKQHGLITVRIEFSPLVQTSASKGHYWPKETTDKRPTRVDAERPEHSWKLINKHLPCDSSGTGRVLFMFYIIKFYQSFIYQFHDVIVSTDGSF